MDWSPQSPNHNITEAVWDHHRMEQKAANIQRRAFNVFQEGWRTIED